MARAARHGTGDGGDGKSNAQNCICCAADQGTGAAKAGPACWFAGMGVGDREAQTGWVEKHGRCIVGVVNIRVVSGGVRAACSCQQQNIKQAAWRQESNRG